MLKRFSAIYSIFIGISVLGMWSMIILTGGITEGLIEISFHLFSEFLMSILLIIGGIGLLRNKVYGKNIFLISNSMLIYSVLNAAGYYGEKSDFIMLFMFLAFFIISSFLIILELLKGKIFS